MSESLKSPPRKPNFSEEEQMLLLDLYAQHREMLSCVQDTRENSQQKADCWASITEQMNEVNTEFERSVFEVKRKWYFLIWQGRRDFMKWKAAEQDPLKAKVTVSPLSSKAVELRWNIRFEDWKDVEGGLPSRLNCSLPSRLKNSEAVPVDASNAEEYDIPEVEEPPQKMRKEAKKKASVDELDGVSALAVVTPLLPNFSTPTSEDETATGTISTNSEGPVAQPTPQTQSPEGSDPPPIKSNCIGTVSPMLNSASDFKHGLWSHNPATSMYTYCTVSGVNNTECDVQAQHDLETIAASASLNQISLESLHQPPVTMATIHPSSSCTINPTSLLASSTILSQDSSSPPPEEPARKRLRDSETVRSKREAELRMDILQLEKDKLWLETEKLRLEIDILRKKKQQMDN